MVLVAPSFVVVPQLLDCLTFLNAERAASGGLRTCTVEDLLPRPASWPSDTPARRWLAPLCCGSIMRDRVMPDAQCAKLGVVRVLGWAREEQPGAMILAQGGQGKQKAF